jgi:hypothetical protein
MIDVIEHIVKGARLTSAMRNLAGCMAGNGVLVLSPVMEKGKKHLFYFRTWSLEDIKKRLPGFVFGELVPFRHSHILSIKKP